MRCFCKAIDEVIKSDGSESADALSKKYKSNIALLQEKGIILPHKTATGRKRTRQGEFSWCYYAQQYEVSIMLEKRAIENESFEEEKRKYHEATVARKRKERQKRKINEATSSTSQHPTHNATPQQQQGQDNGGSSIMNMLNDASSRSQFMILLN